MALRLVTIKSKSKSNFDHIEMSFFSQLAIVCFSIIWLVHQRILVGCMAFFCQSKFSLCHSKRVAKVNKLKSSKALKMGFVIRQLAAKAIRTQQIITRSSSTGHGGEKCKEIVTLNDMPVPNGDFYAHHACRNRRYNSVLIFGIVMFVSATALFYGNVHKSYFQPPKNM